jgi:hypothetical protein
MSQDKSVIKLRSFLIYGLAGTAIVVAGSFAALEIILHIALAAHEHGH